MREKHEIIIRYKECIFAEVFFDEDYYGDFVDVDIALKKASEIVKYLDNQEKESEAVK